MICLIVNLWNYADYSVDRNQKNLPAATREAFSGLAGYDWGQHGEFVVFAQVAYRTENNGVVSMSFITSYYADFVFKCVPWSSR